MYVHQHQVIKHVYIIIINVKLLYKQHYNVIQVD